MASSKNRQKTVMQKTVLLIGPDFSKRQALMAHLMNEKLLVAKSNDAKDAIHYLYNSPRPDLILISPGLSHDNQVRVSVELNSNSILATIPVIELPLEPVAEKSVAAGNLIFKISNIIK